MSWPSKVDRAAGQRRAGGSRQRPSVDLPQPDSPTSPSVSPRRTSKLDAVHGVHARDLALEATPFLIGKYLSTSSATSSGRRVAARSTRLTRSALGVASLGAPPRFSRSADGRRPDGRARPWRSSSGVSLRQRSNRCAQRGAKLQPAGRSTSDGGRPGIAASRCGRGPVEPRDRARAAPTCTGAGASQKTSRFGALLDDPPGVHHHHAVGDLGDDADVVRDQDDRRAELGLEPLDQLQDLGLDRDVERGRRLVGDQQVGVARERHRDHHALPHAARELVRVVVDPPLGVRDADRAQQLDHARRAAASFETASCARICSAICQPTL